MKIIEALKGIKALRKKQDDLCRKIRDNAALLSIHTPPYGDKQKETVDGWLQAVEALSQEIAEISLRLQITNLKTNVTIELEGLDVTRSIAYWIIRRRSLVPADFKAWRALTDRGLEEQRLPGSDETTALVRFYDSARRDAKLVALGEEPSIIDAKLEIANATTDLLEL
jgi:hypothetical protein